MEKNTLIKPPSGRVSTFLKHLRQLARIELFEKWFGFGVKMFWVGLFVAFCLYLRKEYKKNIFYVQDFKVPPAWVEQGYSGDVVKQAIIDEIDKILNSVYGTGQSQVGSNEDNTVYLNDFSIQGFNLRAVTKSILVLLGKKDKSIGGYITIDDSTQTVAIQVTDQITQPISIKRNEPYKNLVHLAAMEIMKVRSPKALIYYYMVKKDSAMVDIVYNYVKNHRELMNDYFFYMTSVAVALNSLDFEEATAWSDSSAKRFPNDKLFYYTRGEIYMTRIYKTKADSAMTRKYKQLFVENMRKVTEPGLLSEEPSLDKTANIYLSGFYAYENDTKSLIDLVERNHMEQKLGAPLNNALAYAYIQHKNYSKAMDALQRAVSQAGDVGDFWDSLAELYSLQGKDSLAVATLAKALKSPRKSAAVSAMSYQTDPAGNGCESVPIFSYY